MTNAQKLEIKKRLEEMREKTKKQKYELQKEISKKKDAIENSKNHSNDNHGLFAEILGIAALIKMSENIRNKRNLNELTKSLDANNELVKKEYLTEKLYEQVKERLDIVEKAESNDLKEFLKENDVYSVFEKGKLEDYLNNKNLSNNENPNKNQNANSSENKTENSQDKNSENSKESKDKKSESESNNIQENENKQSKDIEEKETKKEQKREVSNASRER